jgi:hypothetical protein
LFAFLDRALSSLFPGDLVKSADPTSGLLNVSFGKWAFYLGIVADLLDLSVP